MRDTASTPAKDILSMTALLRKYWFLIGLMVLIPNGLWIGYRFDPAQTEGVLSLINPRWTTALVLFLMAFTLDSRQVVNSLKAPGPVVLASVINLTAIPLMAMGLAPLQSTPDFQVGLMIAASVPCTLAAASVWTRKAQGNDAVSLLVTLVTNSLCVIATPFWLKLGTSKSVPLDLQEMTLRLVMVVLVPTLLGQVARLRPAMSDLATRHKVPIGVVAQSLILLLVFTAAGNAGQKLAEATASVSVPALLQVWLCCIGLHLVAMAMGWYASRAVGFALRERAAVVFASSQKTLPIGVLLATDPAMFGAAGVPFAIFPMLMFHASQLLIDTSIALRLSKMADREKADAAAALRPEQA